MKKFTLTLFASIISASLNICYAEPVWQQSFDTEETLASFTVIDGNADGTTWKWSEKRQLALYNGDKCMNTADDWLFSPALTLSKDKVYKFKYNARSFENCDNETMGVFLGKSASAESMTTELMSPQRLQANIKNGNMERIIRVEADGTYHIGFHAMSEAGQGYVMVDDIVLEELCPASCPAAGEIAVAAGESGRIAADILVVAPSSDLSGSRLDGTLSLKLQRCKHDHYTQQPCECAWEDIWSKDNVKPGSEDIVSDTKAESGFFTYRLVAVNESGEGLPFDYTVVVGIDLPRAVSDITLTRADNGDATISWTPSDKGVNDGYVSTKDLKYHIEMSTGDNWQTLEDEWTGTSYTVQDVPWEGNKETYQFKIYPVNEAGLGESRLSPFFTTGEPYPLPFKDSFDIYNTPIEEMPIWIVPEVDFRHWSLMMEISQDNDKLCAVAYMESSGVTIDMLGAEIDFSKVVEPELEFWFYHAPEYGSPTLQVVVSPEYGAWEVAHEVKLNAAEATSEWTKVTVPLKDYADKKWIQFGWRATSATPFDMLFVDNVTLSDKATQGVDDVAGEDAFTVVAQKGGIAITGRGDVRVYSISGMLVSAVHVSGTETVSCAPGLYVVQSNGGSRKVLVR